MATTPTAPTPEEIAAKRLKSATKLALRIEMDSLRLKRLKADMDEGQITALDAAIA